MELRKHINRPARFREESNEPKKELPRTSYVHESIPFNPHLRPACFPTLALDQNYPDDSTLTNNSPEPASPTLVLRDPRSQRDENEKMADLEPNFTRLLKDRGEFSPVENLEPGEYDGSSVQWVDEEGSELPRFLLPSFAPKVEWDQLAEGMQLVIIREFTRKMSYQAVTDFLQLKHDSLIAFARLTHREFIRHIETERRMKICNEKQLALTLSGNFSSEEWEACTDEMISGLDVPVAFFISQKDAQLARRFLLDFRYREEFPEYVDLEPEDQDVRGKDNFDYSSIPSFEVWRGVINYIYSSVGTMTSEIDLDYKKGVFEIYYDTQTVLLEDERFRKLHANDGDDPVQESIQGEEQAPKVARIKKSHPKVSTIAEPFSFMSTSFGGPLPVKPKPAEQPQPPRQPQLQPQQQKKSIKKKTNLTQVPSSKPQGVIKKKHSTPRATGPTATKASNAPSRLREVINLDDDDDDLETPVSSEKRLLTAAAAITQPAAPTRAVRKSPSYSSPRLLQAQKMTSSSWANLYANSQPVLPPVDIQYSPPQQFGKKN